MKERKERKSGFSWLLFLKEKKADTERYIRCVLQSIPNTTRCRHNNMKNDRLQAYRSVASRHERTKDRCALRLLTGRWCADKANIIELVSIKDQRCSSQDETTDSPPPN